MNRLKSGLIALGILAIVFGFTGQASAGGGNVGGLASCETTQVNGPSLAGDASVVLDQFDNGDVTLHLTFNGQDFFFRAYMTGINTGSSTNQMACDILNNHVYFDGTINTTLNAAIVSALGFTKPKVIMIAKNSIVAPAGSIGSIPSDPRSGVRSTLVSVTLYAQQQ